MLLLAALVLLLWRESFAEALAGQVGDWCSGFTVKHVVVTGNGLILAPVVLELAQVPVGCSVVDVPCRAVRARVERHPWIARAEVRRRLPDTIVIRVTERQSAAAVRGDTLLIISDDGMALAPPAQPWVWDLPLLTPPTRLYLSHGIAVRDSSTLALLQQVLLLKAVSPETWRNLSELYYRDGQMLAALSDPPLDIALGRGVSQLGWSCAVAFLREQGGGELARCRTLDLRVPGKIIVTEKESSDEGRHHG